MLPPFSPISGARLKWGLGMISWTRSPCSSFGCILRNCRFSDSSPRVQNMNSFFFLIGYLLHLVLIRKRSEFEFLNKSYFLPDLGRSKPQQPLNKWEGRRQLFPFGAHSRSNAIKQIIYSAWNWFGMKQRGKKHILHKLMVTTNWARQVLTIFETNEKGWNYFLSLPNLIQYPALGGRVTRWLLSNPFQVCYSLVSKIIM